MSRLSLDKEKILQRYRDGQSLRQISDDFDTSVRPVRSLLLEAGITLKSKAEACRTYTGSYKRRADDSFSEDVRRRYETGESACKIARSLGVNPRTVLRALRKQGVLIMRGAERTALRCDEGYFDTVDSEEKAYWLGLLGADGWVSKRSIVGLEMMELEMVGGLKVALQAKNAISIRRKSPPRKTMYSLQIKSKRMVTALAGYGFNPRKSYTFVPNLSSISPGLHRHFWRGYFDGDGCLTKLHRGDGSPFWWLQLIGTKDTCEAFLKFLDCNSKRITFSKRSCIRMCTFGGTHSVFRVASMLYDKATIYLYRKRLLFLRMKAEMGSAGNTKTRRHGASLPVADGAQSRV